MFSTLPKLADRAFILSAFFPTLIFAIIVLAMFSDFPAAAGLIDSLTARAIQKGAYLLLGVSAGAAAMLMINEEIYRFMKGELLPTPIARRLRRRNRTDLQAILDKIEGLHPLRAPPGQRPNSYDAAYRSLKIARMQRLPSTAEDVGSTRLANAIRAFEVYPRDVYGVDGYTMWFRLTSVLPANVASQIQDIRSQIDLLLNCCFFSLIIAALALARAFLSASWAGGIRAAVLSIEPSWLVEAASGAAAAYIFYHWAVMRVPLWGVLVMSAFDCYLPALATQLGFKLPTEEAKRRLFWTTLSRQMSYGRDPDGPFDASAWSRADPHAFSAETTPSASPRGASPDEGGSPDKDEAAKD